MKIADFWWSCCTNPLYHSWNFQGFSTILTHCLTVHRFWGVRLTEKQGACLTRNFKVLQRAKISILDVKPTYIHPTLTSGTWVVSIRPSFAAISVPLETPFFDTPFFDPKFPSAADCWRIWWCTCCSYTLRNRFRLVTHPKDAVNRVWDRFETNSARDNVYRGKFTDFPSP